MTLFQRPMQFEETQFAPNANDRPALYGLPEDVVFCKKCVISNQRPSSSVEFRHQASEKKVAIQFQDDQICDACRFAEKKKEIDWAEREKKCWDLCAQHRRDDGRYDCIVAGSGGKDGFYASWMLKNKYGMHPLTVTWAPHIYTDWGWRNFQGWLHAGFDNHLFTPNGKINRLLTRLALENLLHPFQPFILGQKNYPPKMAARHDISLVFYGENEAEYGNPVAENKTAKRDLKYFAIGDGSDVYLGGASLYDLKDIFKLEDVDVAPYMPADPEAIANAGVEVHYMGYYEKWHPQNAYYYAVENGNFQASPERTAGTYSKYSGIDDKMDDLHYFTTFIKFGIGRAVYDAAQEVRNEDITREEAVSLARRFDGEFPERFINELFEYLSISEVDFPAVTEVLAQSHMDRVYFMDLLDRFRSPHIWMRRKGEWVLRHTAWGD